VRAITTASARLSFRASLRLCGTKPQESMTVGWRVAAVGARGIRSEVRRAVRIDTGNEASRTGRARQLGQR
jgi:hypothetical protein